ncbi:MAG: lysophospholipid acyltransferase family protein [Desulfuromonadales bacterium]
MPAAERGSAGWSSRSVGSRLQHRIFYLLIGLGGRRPAYALLYLVVLYYVLFRPSLRRRSYPYLRRRFPRQPPRLVDSFRMSLALGQVLVDRATVGILGPAALRVGLEGRKELIDLVAEGRGLILMTAHVGCWQVAMSAFDFLQAPVNLLLQREDGDIDRHYFEHAGIESPYRIIDPRGFLGGTLEMIAALKRGEVLSVMGDRMLGNDRNGIEADFLGAPVRFPYSAYKLASATGAPVAILLSAKTGPDVYALRLCSVLRVPAGLGRKAADFAPFAARFAEILEQYCGEHPYQFFNFFDLWEPSPASPANARSRK